jgi:hypothetical protein
MAAHAAHVFIHIKYSSRLPGSVATSLASGSRIIEYQYAAG